MITRAVELPPAGAPGAAGSWVELPAAFEPLTAATLTVVIEAVQPVASIDRCSGSPIDLPVGVADLTLPGVGPVAPPADLPDGCRADLVAIDGQPVPVRILGDGAAAAAGGALAVEACGGSLALGPGTVRIETASGRDTGIDIDRLVLHGAGTGGTARPAAPALEIGETGRGSAQVRVTGATEPYWVVLGQSHGEGWEAEVDGGPSLGRSTLVDGFANGWLVDPAVVGADARIDLTWTPGRPVRAGLLASAAVAVLCLGLVLWPGTRRTAVPAAVPALAWPPRPEPLLPRRVALGSAVVTAGFVTLASRPSIGLAAGVLVLSCGWWRRTRLALAVAGVGALALAGADVAVQQLRYGAPHDGAWPALWDRPHLLGWVALAALAGDAVLEVVTARRRSRPGPAPGGDASLP